ncbi:hypothetical protein D9757_014634 [Collybiopsis confluens]|uniref:Glucose-methanol-choline oxidoreductase N-terminal domain-containing protein n=1 Tax=Collybiopsis confluens TaxID=2823264 RepID=A0A8H5FNE1_9AGAR|nr:hypothetical protein D9757_014634 [Collybiopsis confluens]
MLIFLSSMIGGVGGCVVAGRLAASDPKLKILILESGPDVKEDILHVQPARFMHHQRADSNTMRFVHSYPDPNLNGRSIQVATAQCFGGGSSVNFSFYARASASDYDDWERVHGNSGWGFKDLLPLFRKVVFHIFIATCFSAFADTLHGYSGPLNVSYGGAFTNIGKEYLEVVAKYDKSRTIVEDGNDFHTVDSFSRWPNNTNSNLSYLTSSPVVRVMLKGKRATGVEYLHKGQTCIANASRLVVVSGGTFGSPAILERSGIGKLDILKKAGIQPVLDLPGIGENFQDHPTAFVSFLASPESQTLEGIINNDPEEIKKWDAEWRINGSGLMASNICSGIEAGIKIRPHPDDLQVLGPAFEKQWKEFYSKYPDKPVVSFGIVSLATLEPEQINSSQKHFRFGYFPLHATSSGSTHITSPPPPLLLQIFVSDTLAQAKTSLS